MLDRNRVLWNFDDYFRGGLLETKSAARIFSVFLIFVFNKSIYVSGESETEYKEARSGKKRTKSIKVTNEGVN